MASDHWPCNVEWGKKKKKNGSNTMHIDFNRIKWHTIVNFVWLCYSIDFISDELCMSVWIIRGDKYALNIYFHLYWWIAIHICCTVQVGVIFTLFFPLSLFLSLPNAKLSSQYNKANNFIFVLELLFIFCFWAFMLLCCLFLLSHYFRRVSHSRLLCFIHFTHEKCMQIGKNSLWIMNLRVNKQL